jgi:peptide-methionine (S)-S-oxide reductase
MKSCLLTIFWNSHDPMMMTLNGQGPDEGIQYRSAVFFHNKDQKAAKVIKEKLQKSAKFGDKKIMTDIVPASTFWKAEENIISTIMPSAA